MVEILDTTLREGEQTPYVNFLLDEKLEIARLLLDRLCGETNSLHNRTVGLGQ